MNMKIKDIPVKERPRERLIRLGVSFLSNEELLALLLKTGYKNNSVKLLANTILKKLDELGDYNNINYNFLINIKGVGEAKATNILAGIELGKRLSRKVDTINNIKMNNAEVIFNYYEAILSNKKQECFYAVYLDNSKRIIKDKLLFMGTINNSVVHPREIFKEAYLLSASAIVCVHNHPSNNIFPSKEDIEVTNNLIKVGSVLGIKIVDHIIIGKGKYYSFFENNDI